MQNPYELDMNNMLSLKKRKHSSDISENELDQKLKSQFVIDLSNRKNLENKIRKYTSKRKIPLEDDMRQQFKKKLKISK